jgi:hypothetical protein
MNVLTIGYFHETAEPDNVSYSVIGTSTLYMCGTDRTTSGWSCVTFLVFCCFGVLGNFMWLPIFQIPDFYVKIPRCAPHVSREIFHKKIFRTSLFCSLSSFVSHKFGIDFEQAHIVDSLIGSSNFLNTSKQDEQQPRSRTTSLRSQRPTRPPMTNKTKKTTKTPKTVLPVLICMLSFVDSSMIHRFACQDD